MDRLSQSYLKGMVNRRPPKSKALYYEEDASDLGSLVDTLVTKPLELHARYYVSDLLAKPGKGALSVIKNTWDNRLSDKLDQNHSRIIQAAKQDGFGGDSWTDERIVNAVIKAGKDWWQAAIEAKGRKVVSKEDMETAETAANKVKSHPFTKFLFSPVNRIVYQPTVLFSHRGHDCKGLIDILIVNDSDKATFLPAHSALIIDLKFTEMPVYEYVNQIRRARHDIQLAWYSLGIARNHASRFKEVGCALLVTSAHDEPPLIFNFSDKDLKIGRHGAFNTPTGYVPTIESDFIGSADVLGYEQLIDIYEWRVKNNEWEYPKEVAEAKGILKTQIWK